MVQTIDGENAEQGALLSPPRYAHTCRGSHVGCAHARQDRPACSALLKRRVYGSGRPSLQVPTSIPFVHRPCCRSIPTRTPPQQATASDPPHDIGGRAEAEPGYQGSIVHCDTSLRDRCGDTHINHIPCPRRAYRRRSRKGPHTSAPPPPEPSLHGNGRRSRGNTFDTSSHAFVSMSCPLELLTGQLRKLKTVMTTAKGNTRSRGKWRRHPTTRLSAPLLSL